MDIEENEVDKLSVRTGRDEQPFPAPEQECLDTNEAFTPRRCPSLTVVVLRVVDVSVLGVVVVLLGAVDGSLGGVIEASVHGAVQTLVVHPHGVVGWWWGLRRINLG